MTKKSVGNTAEPIEIKFPKDDTITAPPTIEELAEKEAPLNIEDPEKTPNRANLLAEKSVKVSSDMAVKLFNEQLVKLDIPYAYVEQFPDLVRAVINIHKGKSKLWEQRNRLDNKFHLTPIKDLEIYESIAEENKKPEDLGGQGTV
jgi:hypothetical protein